MPVDPRIASPLDSAEAALAVAREAGAVIADESDVLKAQVADAVTGQNKLHDDLTAQQAALATAVAENAALRKQLDAGGSGIPLWKPGASIISASTAWIVPDGTSDNIVVPPGASGVALYLGAGLYGKLPQRPFLTIGGDNCDVKSIAAIGTRNFDLPPGTPLKDGRYAGYAECVRVGDDSGLTGRTVRGTRLRDLSAGRANAFVKCFPDAVDTVVDRPVSGDDLLADGVYSGGARNVYILNPSLRARNENTIRATMDHGVVPDGLFVFGGSSTNTGNKSAVNPRNVRNCVLFGVSLSATDLNSAVGIGNGGGLNPGDVGPSFVRVELCTIPSGSLSVHQGTSIYLLRNLPAWQQRSENSFISLNATPGNLSDIKVIDNAGPSPVAQKAILGYGMGKRENINGFEERGNNWTVKP